MAPALMKEFKKARRPVKPSWIALAGLVAAVGRGTAEVASMREIVGVVVVPLLLLCHRIEIQMVSSREDLLGAETPAAIARLTCCFGKQ